MILWNGKKNICNLKIYHEATAVSHNIFFALHCLYQVPNIELGRWFIPLALKAKHNDTHKEDSFFLKALQVTLI